MFLIPSADLNVGLPTSLLDIVKQAGRNTDPRLVLFFAVTLEHRNYALRMFLRNLAPVMLSKSGRTVIAIDCNTTQEAFDALLAKGVAGALVLMSELVPNAAWQYRSVVNAAKMVGAGATVIAAIHGHDETSARARLATLWSQTEPATDVAPLTDAQVQVHPFDVIVQVCPVPDA